MNTFFRKTLFYAFSLLLTALFLEGGMRVVYLVKKGTFSHCMPLKKADSIRKIIPYKDNADVLTKKGAFLVKNGYYTFDPESNEYKNSGIKINSLGFRGDEVTAADGSRTRVLCLGGSSTFGYNVNKSYPEFLESLLNKRQEKYEVINCGVIGLNAQHLYNMLRDRRLMNYLRPDVIVVNTYWNTLEQYENNFLTEAAENRFMRGMLRHSVLAFFIYKAVLFVKYGEFIGPFQALCLYTDKICKWAEKNRIPVILLKEPMIMDENAWLASPQHPQNHARATKIFKGFEEKYNGRVFFCSVSFFEEKNGFDAADSKKYFIDRGHLTEEGYEIEAEALRDVVEKVTCSEKWPKE